MNLLRLFCALLPLLSAACEPADPIDPALRPTIDLISATEVTDRSAVVGARIAVDPTLGQFTVGFAWRAVETGEYAEVICTDFADGVARQTLAGLKPATEYRWHAWITLGSVRINSALSETFTTQAEGAGEPAKPLFEAMEVVELTATAVTLRCAYTYAGDEPVAVAGFRYRAAGSAVEMSQPAATTESPIELTISALKPEVEYTVAAYVVIGGATTTGEAISFTTPADTSEVPEPPTYTVYRTGWAELPMHVEKTGDYYYAYHMRPDSPADRNYSICYSAEHRCALWTAAAMHPDWDQDAGRNEEWQYDPVIPQSVQPNLSRGYVNSGDGAYSRGHLVASADRQISRATNKTTFYFTNMAPQVQDGFNGGIWATLEDRTQRAWNCTDTLYMVSGVYFADDDKHCQDVDGREIGVPTHFYKVLIRSKSGRTGKALADLSAEEIICTGFWFENKSHKGGLTSTYMKSVAEIEELTGFTFFPNVPGAPKEQFTASDWL